jgi:hypothetical protein
MRQARLVRIAKVLHVPVAALLAGMDDPKRPDAALPGALLSARTPLRLATAFAAIDDKMRHYPETAFRTYPRSATIFTHS